MSVAGYGITQGIKSIQQDSPAKTLVWGGNLTNEFKTLKNYKALSTILKIKGEIVVTADKATNAEATATLNYKDDHFYNLIKGFKFQADNDVIKNLQENLAFFRFWLAYYQEGYESLQKIPQSVKIANGQSVGRAKVEVNIVIPFVFYDMVNLFQTSLLTWLYDSIFANYQVTGVDSVIASVSVSGGGLASAKATFENFSLESYTDYAIVNNAYLTHNEAGQALTANGVLGKIGGSFKVDSKSEIFTGQGNNQFIKLLPTNVMQFKDLFVICRDVQTGKRVDGIIDKITLKDGSRSIVDCDINTLRNFELLKYKINPLLWAESNLNYIDKKGPLYGVIRIDGSNFNDMTNSVLATGTWNNPYLYFDINDKIQQYSKGVKFEVVQCYKEVSQSTQAKANAFATQSVETSIS